MPSDNPRHDKELMDLWPGPWKRSLKGTFWRQLPDGTKVSVYRHQGRWFTWCIADGEGPNYSSRHYPTELRAVEGLMGVLEARGYDLSGREGA